MREFTKALLSYSLATSLFGLKQMQNLITPSDPDEHRGPATKAFDSVTNATINQFGGTLKSLFGAVDNVQRGLVSLTFSFFLPFASGRGLPEKREQRQSGVRWTSEPVPATALEEAVSLPQTAAQR